MNETLHPSSLGEILDRTVQLYRARFLVFFGIAAVPTAVIVVVAAGIYLLVAWSGDFSNPAVGAFAGISIFGIALVALPVYVVATALASAALNHSAARALFDQKITIVDAYKAVWGNGWRYIGLYLLEGLIVAGAPLTVWFVLVGISAFAGAFLQKSGFAFDTFFAIEIVLVLIALATYCVWMVLRLSLALPACVVEKLGAWLALKRSISLANGTMGRIFLLYLLGSVLNYVLSMMIVFPILIVATLIQNASSPEHGQSIYTAMAFAAYCVAFAVQALTKPVYGIALVLFYYDQRIRLEGFDIEWMMLRAGLVVPNAPQPQMALATGPETPPPAEPA
jgi:hypothetical protein